MSVADVRHVDTYFATYKDFKRVGQHLQVRGKRTQLFAAAFRVLELMRKEQIQRLVASGIAEESITEDMLGFAMTWELFSERADGNYSPRSFESIIEKVLASGAATRCYVECQRRRKDENGRVKLVLVTDANGQPITYATIEEAREKCASECDIIHYFHFNAEAVNKLIATAYSKTTPDGNGPGGRKAKKGGAQRGPQSGESGHAEQPPTENTNEQTEDKRVNLRPGSSPVSSDATIPQGSQFCESMSTDISKKTARNARKTASLDESGSQFCGEEARSFTEEGSQFCEDQARNSASNKNLIGESLESTEESITIGAPGAIWLTLSHFDFSQTITPEAIDSLARLLYPSLKEPALVRVTASARKLAESGIVAKIGLRALAANMLYQVDETSPCRWRPWCRKTYNKPKLAMRPWHLESETVLWKMHQEREEAGWWPDVLPMPTGLVETPPEIDLMELSGLDRSEAYGMDAEVAEELAAGLTEMFARHSYPYEVRLRRVSSILDRGVAIEVWYDYDDARRCVRFYCPEHWDLIVDAQEFATWGSLDFVFHLAQRCEAYALDDSGFDYGDDLGHAI